jgi:hypothetical protein
MAKAKKRSAPGGTGARNETEDEDLKQVGAKNTPAAKKWKGRTRYQKGESATGEAVRGHIYVDKNGRNYHLVEKLDSGRYRQSHWVEGGLNAKSGWQLGKPKGPLIPYNLDTVLKAPPQRPIWFCEGENDADTLDRLNIGLVATTNPGGAGKWTAELDHWFVGKQRAFVLEDNDNAGRAHARKVAQHLYEIVDEVRIVRLPGLAENDDVTDWLAAGHTAEELMKLAAEAPLYNGLQRLQLYTGHDERTATDMLSVVLNAGHPVFVRAGFLVEPIWQERKNVYGDLIKSLVFVKITPHKFIDILTKYALCQRFNARANKGQGEWIPCSPPKDDVIGLLERRHWGAHPVSGAINVPTMRNDGSIVDTPGWDESTELWLEMDRDFSLPPIAEQPTIDDARRAYSC